jgi:hypothetical protein
VPERELAVLATCDPGTRTFGLGGYSRCRERDLRHEASRIELARSGHVEIADAVPSIAMRWCLVVLLSGCIVAARSLEMPANDVTTVALLTGTLGHPMDGIARHPWFAVRKAGEKDWRIYEVGGGGRETDPFHDHSPYGEPILHGLWRGEEAERAASCIEKVGPGIKHDIERHYFLVPGPNSNTFGDVVLRLCGLHASLPATSVGKDYRGWFGVNWSSEGTGFQVETAILGFKLGLKEGVEIHVLGLSVGVDLWPPAIIVPLGPGRIGFADR